MAEKENSILKIIKLEIAFSSKHHATEFLL